MKRNLGGPGKTLTEDFDGFPDLARELWTHETDERAQPHAHAVENAYSVGTASASVPVESAVRVLEQGNRHTKPGNNVEVMNDHVGCL